MVRRALRICAVLLAIGASAPGCSGGSSSTPISEQSCHQLAATYRQLRDDLKALDDRELNGGEPTDFEAHAKNSEDVITLNARVDELGGCLGEPDLQ